MTEQGTLNAEGKPQNGIFLTQRRGERGGSQRVVLNFFYLVLGFV